MAVFPPKIVPKQGKMQEERPFHEEYKGRMKCVSILCGLLLFALAAQSFGELYVKTPTDVILPVYYVCEG